MYFLQTWQTAGQVRRVFWTSRNSSCRWLVSPCGWWELKLVLCKNNKCSETLHLNDVSFLHSTNRYSFKFFFVVVLIHYISWLLSQCQCGIITILSCIILHFLVSKQWSYNPSGLNLILKVENWLQNGIPWLKLLTWLLHMFQDKHGFTETYKC